MTKNVKRENISGLSVYPYVLSNGRRIRIINDSGQMI